MGRRSLKAIYRERLLKEAKKRTPKLLYVVSYDIPGSTPTIRMRLSRHVQALMEVSKELGFLCERRTWSCFLCDEKTMPVLNNILLDLGCKPDIFPVALNLTIVERHLIEALKKLDKYDIKEARRHIEAALKELRGEPYIPAIQKAHKRV